MLERYNPPHYAATVMTHTSNRSFMASIPTGSVKLIVTSPPYNIGKAYERRTDLDGHVTEQAKVIKECVRLLHHRGSICWQVGNHVQDGEIFPLDIILYPVFAKLGLKLRNRIVWHSEDGTALFKAAFRSPRSHPLVH